MENENYPKCQNQDTRINSHFGPCTDHSACSETSYKALHMWKVQVRRFPVPSHIVSASTILHFFIHQCLHCSKGFSSQTNTRLCLPENTSFSPFY